jgi:hypothetical protein
VLAAKMALDTGTAPFGRGSVAAFLFGVALLAPQTLAAQAAQPATGEAAGEWRSLFDGKSLEGWKESAFFGAGKVTIENGAVILGSGILTGITWAGSSLPFPRTNYEIRIEAEKISGSDFFAGITFPVGDSYCTWINGGWGGEIVGLSSIDGGDASMNETTSLRKFDLRRWYSLRLRVTGKRISAWIDGEPAIDFEIGKKWIGLREGDIDRSIPFGIASYSTVAGVRKIEYRLLAPEPGPKQQ